MRVTDLLSYYAKGDRHFIGADLHASYLRGVCLYAANLRDADLRYADLRYADLQATNLQGADLRGAIFRNAHLRDARLRGATLNWTSHDLLAEILRQAAGCNNDRLMLAGLVYMRRDWCWTQFSKFEHPEKAWAIRELAGWVKVGYAAPALVLNAVRQR